MQREIEFRGQDKNGNWHYGYYTKDVYRGSKKVIDCIVEYSEYTLNGKKEIDIKIFDVIPETIGQYIGMKDKNGKKIYEGDKVRCTHYNFGSWGEELEHSYIYIKDRIVKFDLSSLRYVFKDPEGGTMSVWNIDNIMQNNKNTIEVIGNITDNPEQKE